MAILVIISVGLDVNSCGSVVSHSIAHAFGDIGNDSLIRRLKLKESFNDDVELNQQLAVFFVRAICNRETKRSRLTTLFPELQQDISVSSTVLSTNVLFVKVHPF